MADESKIQEIVTAYPFKRGTTLSHVSLNQICEGLSNVTDGVNTKQDVLTAGDNIQITNNVISATDTKYVAGDFDIKDLSDADGLRTKWDNAATLAATAIQPDVLQQQLSNYLTETEVNELIAEIHSFEVKIVDALPESGNTHTIYFVPVTDGADSDFYNEYMYINGKMELIGNTRIDLSGYYTKDEIDDELDKKQNTLVAGTNIEISGDTISSKVYEASEFDIKDLADTTGLRTKWDAKQDAITDLDEIRSGATLGATAIQENELNEALSVYLTSAQTMELIGEIDHFAVKVVDVLPVSGEPNTIYFVSAEGGESTDAKNEYIYVEGVGWELIGTTRIDLTDYYTSGKTDELLATKQDVLTAGTNIEISGDTISVVGLSDVLYTEISYSELVVLRDASGLTAGMQYRLTDYTTTVNPSLSDVQSAGHVFDIILVADDETTLNENVRFIHHEGDTYFADSDLSAWEGKYCLDNDTNKFAWTDDSTNGKGVIYWLKDEYNNECPYDFKNIQFNILNGFTYSQWGGNYLFTRNSVLDEEISGVTYYGYTCSQTPSAWSSPNCFVTDSVITTTSTLYSSAGGSTISYSGNIVSVNLEEKYGIYTFSVDNNGIFEDGSLLSSNNIYGNVILNYIIEGKLNLNRIWFIGVDIKGNTFGTDCCNNTFGNNCQGNTFGNGCNGNTFGNDFRYNTFGNYCYNNTFGNSCNNNTFGNYCNSNTFGNYCNSNTFGNSCNNNTFGNDCYNNTFGNSCGGNTFGNSCDSNTFGNGCFGNTFGNSCGGNTFGNYCYNNTFGNDFRYNTFGNDCYNNTFGNGYIKECRFGDGVQYCTISGYENLTGYGTYYYLRNIVVLNGTKGQDGQLLELNENQIFNTHNFKPDGELVPQIVCGFFVNENNVMTYIAKYYFAATLG